MSYQLAIYSKRAEVVFFAAAYTSFKEGLCSHKRSCLFHRKGLVAEGGVSRRRPHAGQSLNRNQQRDTTVMTSIACEIFDRLSKLCTPQRMHGARMTSI